MITLTPNRRLAAVLNKLFAEEQLHFKKKCWQTPLILPFASFLEKLWHEYTVKTFASHPRILTSIQNSMIWEDIITQSEASLHLIQKSETAELAKSAWGLLKQHQIKLMHPKLASTEDSTVFLTWAKNFQEYCNKHNCLDQHALTDVIIQKIQARDIRVTDDINLYGFTELVPQHKTLLACLENQGINITYQHTTITTQTIERTQFSDTETEMRAMAKAAKQYYDQNPAAKIGCVVPNLEDKRETIVRIFSETFTPKGFYTMNPLTLPFNISAGKNLSRYPVIRAALSLLALQQTSISIEKLSMILRSPFLGEAEEEFLSRSGFVDQLYQANIATLPLHRLITKPNFQVSCPKLTNRFKLLLENTYSRNETRKISEWVNYFVTCLTVLGWPGERSTNSEEYQTIERWLNLLNQLKQADDFLPAQSYDTALHYLHQITQNDVFQPESPEAPIQILGLLEAAEVPFDYLWVMGLDDTTWPPAPTPNPFIPVYLQKNLNFPHASSERELQFCKTITEQLKNSSRAIMFSSALHQDETELRPSALIETIPINSENILFDNNNTLTHFIFTHQAIEKIIDISATPIRDEKISSGRRILELQAACPFKAFAEMRLQAKPIEPLALGLRAIDRGIIIHHILELFWRKVRNSTTLKNQSDEVTQTLIRESIQTALSAYEKTTSKRYFALEAVRLTHLILKWIDVEKSRPDFSVIAFEQTYSTQIGNIPVTVRIDRIDEVEPNKKFIIDYKTGKKLKLEDCFGHRPDALQLPLYCMIHPEETIGIAYAKIHPEKMELLGISQFDLEIKNIKTMNKVSYTDAPTWNEQIHCWEKTLTALSNDFCQGQAAVNPKHAVDTCQHCQLKPLCRIQESDDYALTAD